MPTGSVTINVNYISVMLLWASVSYSYICLLDGFNNISQRNFKLNISKTNLNIHSISTLNLTSLQRFPTQYFYCLYQILQVRKCFSCKYHLIATQLEFFSLHLLNISQPILLLFQYHPNLSYHDFSAIIF